MKRKLRRTGFLLLVAGLLLTLSACGSSGKFGAPIITTEETPINEILDDPGSFIDKTVMVEGQIQTVDDDGRGFGLDNGLGSLLYVKVTGDFEVPKGAKYKLAAAEGKITLDKKTGEPRLLASGVEVK